MTRLIPIRLWDLTLNEEFVTSLTRRQGRVVSWGHVRWHDTAGRVTRVRSVLVVYGTEQKIHRAEMTVLVPSERTHRRISDESRWDELLPEPGTFATVGDVATRRAVAPRRQVNR